MCLVPSPVSFNALDGWRVDVYKRQEVQTLRVSERMEEFMFLGLRLTKGIELQTFEHQFGKSFWDVYQDAADKLFSEQLLCLDESKKNLRLTDYGVDVSKDVYKRQPLCKGRLRVQKLL